MGEHRSGGFAVKHGPGTEVDSRIRAAVTDRGKDGQLACAAAFTIAKTLAVSVAEVGRAADLLEYHLTHCQLGLFGYRPEKKIVTPAASVSEALAAAIRSELADGRLPCRAAWAIADAHGIGKREVSAACEALGIKIKPCQLGAF